ncbi:hypothetical protein LCGC14_2187990 [marine sediment metagenome]|uniref:Uncharacterized protein n=1 Tax=marine sediment metagenome TaxID=412755 RepID=A0A0F9DKK0_9ZZZZ
MKLSKTDLRILMAIKVEGSSMCNSKIARRLNLHPPQTQKRLKILKKYGILEEIEGWPKLYHFNMHNHSQDFIINTIECPKCQRMHIRHHSQLTVQCSCKTPAGKYTRFYVFDSRIKDKKVLQRQSEKSNSTTEIENDVQEIINPS